jgi:hypothetical protein
MADTAVLEYGMVNNKLLKRFTPQTVTVHINVTRVNTFYEGDEGAPCCRDARNPSFSNRSLKSQRSQVMRSVTFFVFHKTIELD